VQNRRLEHLLDERNHPDEVRHLGHPDLDDLHLVRHQGDQPHLGHPDLDGLARLDADLGDPCPAKERMGCCLDGKLGVECPYPGPMQTGCCLDEECLRHPVPVA